MIKITILSLISVSLMAVDSQITEVIAGDLDENMQSKIPIELRNIKTTTVYEIIRETGKIVTGKVFNAKGKIAWYDKPQWNDKMEMIGSVAYDSAGKMLFKTFHYKSLKGNWESIITDENGYEIKEEDAMAITLKLVSVEMGEKNQKHGDSKF